MKKGSKYLKVTSILEIIIGIVSILLIRFLLVQDETVMILSKELAVSTLWSMVLIYGVNIFKILAGILGLCKSNKKSMITIICGLLLVVAHGANFLIGEISVVSILLDIIPLLIPAYYLYGAVLNYKESK